MKKDWSYIRIHSSELKTTDYSALKPHSNNNKKKNCEAMDERCCQTSEVAENIVLSQRLRDQRRIREPCMTACITLPNH